MVITDATQRLVAGMFVIEDRGPQTLKGLTSLRLHKENRPGERPQLREIPGAPGGTRTPDPQVRSSWSGPEPFETVALSALECAAL